MAKFEHLRPSSSQSGYQASMFDGEDATSARPGSVIYMLQGMGGGHARVRARIPKLEFAIRTKNSIFIAKCSS